MTKKPDKYWLFKAITLVPLLLSGCVSFSEPVQTGEHTYMITANAHGGFSSNGELEGETIQKAKDFCATQGLKAALQNASASGVQGWTPQNTQVVFNCLPSCDELYADPALDAIRTKVALGGIKDQTLAMRTNNFKPTPSEMAAIALWDQKRQICRAGEPPGIAQSTAPVAGAVLVNSHEDMEQLIAELYSRQITYGQFASIRSGLFEHAVTGTAQALETAKIQNATAAAALKSAQAQQQAAQAQQQSAIAQQTEANAMQNLSQRPIPSPSTSFNCQTYGNTTHCQ